MSVTANLTTNVETITATIVVEDETIIAQVSAAARGPAGEAGAAGPNALTTATTTNLTGFISGNGTNISGATAAASAATANTLVLRDANGGASFAGVTLSGINTNSGSYAQVGGANFNVATTTAANLTATGSGTVTVSGAGGTTISGGTLTFSPSGFAYGAGAASAHRTALGLGTADDVGFRTVNVSGTAPSNTPAAGIGLTSAAHFALFANSTVRMVVISTGATIGSGSDYAWSSLATPTNATRDLILARDAANTLAQRNGTAAQESRIYGTYTGAGNYRRLALKMDTAGVAQIVAEGGGSGAAGNRLEFVTGGATRMTVEAGGNIGVGTSPSIHRLKIQNTSVVTQFQVAGQTTTKGAFLTGSDNGFFIGGNNYFNGSAWVAVDPAVSTMTAESGTIRFFTSSGHTVGGTFTPTERLRITSSGLLTFGGITNSFPAIKRNGIAINIRLADDSADAPLTCSNLTASGTIQTGGYTFADLPTSPTTGMRAYITNGADIPLFMANAAGGGSTVTPVFYNGTNWINA